MKLFYREKLDQIINQENISNSLDVIYELMNHLFNDWNAVFFISQMPRCGETLWLYMFSKIQQLDLQLNPDMELPGDIWIEFGFPADETLNDWEIDKSRCLVLRTTIH